MHGVFTWGGKRRRGGTATAHALDGLCMSPPSPLPPQHMLPNFNECWWDSWVLDVAVCNFAGGCRHTPQASLLAAAVDRILSMAHRGLAECGVGSWGRPAPAQARSRQRSQPKRARADAAGACAIRSTCPATALRRAAHRVAP